MKIAPAASMSDPLIRSLPAHAVEPSRVSAGGGYTNPRTWGVYAIEPSRVGGATKHSRFGNHPARQRELEGEFGFAERIALFTCRATAEELARGLNRSS